MTMAWKTCNVGVVKHPAKASNNRRNEMGRLSAQRGLNAPGAVAAAEGFRHGLVELGRD